MTLDSRVRYPSSRTYVLKLEYDAEPSTTRLAGRLENIATGHAITFCSVEELIDGLSDDHAEADDDRTAR